MGLRYTIPIKIFFIVIVSVLGASLATAKTNTLKIAVTAPFTGPYSGYGTQLLSGAQQAVNLINQRGGLKGIQLEVVPIDDQCDPGIAVNQAKKIVDDKNFQAVIGHACSSACLAALEVYAPSGMLVISPTATNENLTKKAVPTFFKMSGNDDLQAQTATSFLVNKLQSKKVAIVHDGDMYSKDLADKVGEYLGQMNNPPTMYMEVARGSRQFKSMLETIAKQEVDAIYFPGLYPEISYLARELDTAGMQIPLMTADGIALHRFISITNNNKAASAVLMTFVNDPHTMDSSQQVIAEMQAHNLEAIGYSLYAYAAIEVLSQAILKTDTTEAKKLAQWIHQNQVATVLGKKSWDTNGNISDVDFKVYLWNQDGTKLEPILG